LDGERRQHTARIEETANLVHGFDRLCHDAFEAAAELDLESGGQGVRGLSDGDDEDAIVGIEIVQIVADAQNTALAVHVAGEGVFDGGVLKSGRKDLARRLAHASKLLGTLGREIGQGGNYKEGCSSCAVRRS